MADPSSPPPFERLTGGDGFGFFAWGAIFVSYNNTQGSDAYLDAFDEALGIHMERNPDAVWMYALHRVKRVTAQPSANARKRAVELLKRVDPILQANVMAFDVAGMTGAIIRTFVSGVFLLTRSRVSNKVCDDPVEGAEWLRDHEPSPPLLAEHFGNFRDVVLKEGDHILGPSPRR